MGVGMNGWGESDMKEKRIYDYNCEIEEETLSLFAYYCGCHIGHLPYHHVKQKEKGIVERNVHKE